MSTEKNVLLKAHVEIKIFELKSPPEINTLIPLVY